MKKTSVFIGVGVAFLWISVASAVEKAALYVAPFDVHEGGKITAGGVKILKDRIEGYVVSSRKYVVVEREDIEKLQEELKLVDSGMADSAKCPRSNELIAAGYRVYGKVMQYRNYVERPKIGDYVKTWVYGTVELQIRIANITTGVILASPTIKVKEKMGLGNAVASNQNLELEVMTKAVDKAAKKVVIALNEIAFPAYMTDADGTYITANVGQDQVVKGELWDVWRRRGVKRNPETDEIEGYREKFVCKVRVALPGPKETKFKVLSVKDGKMLEEEYDTVADLPKKDRAAKAIVLRRAPDEEQDKVDGNPITRPPKPLEDTLDL